MVMVMVMVMVMAVAVAVFASVGVPQCRGLSNGSVISPRNEVEDEDEDEDEADGPHGDIHPHHRHRTRAHPHARARAISCTMMAVELGRAPSDRTIVTASQAGVAGHNRSDSNNSTSCRRMLQSNNVCAHARSILLLRFLTSPAQYIAGPKILSYCIYTDSIYRDVLCVSLECSGLSKENHEPLFARRLHCAHPRARARAKPRARALELVPIQASTLASCSLLLVRIVVVTTLS